MNSPFYKIFVINSIHTHTIAQPHIQDGTAIWYSISTVHMPIHKFSSDFEQWSIFPDRNLFKLEKPFRSFLFPRNYQLLLLSVKPTRCSFIFNFGAVMLIADTMDIRNLARKNSCRYNCSV